LHCAPSPLAPTVIHGDFRLGNLLAVGADIKAIVDWEIWSIGDPRIDAGWFLINCDPDTYRRVPASPAVAPPITELAEIYARAGGSVADLAWFTALACFKSAATWSLIVKHNRRRRSPRAELEAMVPTLPRLLARALSLVG
jgi:aminoglycoside phosphotransferase (APT) family kinase protein